jgi:hypothetical protein
MFLSSRPSPYTQFPERNKSNFVTLGNAVKLLGQIDQAVGGAQ